MHCFVLVYIMDQNYALPFWKLSTFAWPSRGLTRFTLYSVDFELSGCLFRRFASVSDAICRDTRIFKRKYASPNYKGKGKVVPLQAGQALRVLGS
jgi:hypothetical protein